MATSGLSSNILPVVDPSNGDTKHYLIAGPHQFRQIWTRDVSMSIVGLLDIGETQAARDTLDVLFENQRGDGLFPRLVDHGIYFADFVLEMFGIHLPFVAPLTGTFEDENGITTIDGNALVPWAASEYVARTQDHDFADRWFGGMQNAVQYLQKNNFSGGLIDGQPPFSDWEDSISREGKVAFTNTAYILALRGTAAWATFLGQSEQAAYYAGQAADAQGAFYNTFWDSKNSRVTNFIHGSFVDDHLATDANLLPVAFGVLPPAESEQIMTAMRASALWSPMPGRATYPDYPEDWKNIFVQIAMIPDYHDRLHWIWLSSLAARAERAVGNADGCEAILDQISQLIANSGNVYEVYDKTGSSGDVSSLTPVSRLLYHAENPFSWSAAWYVQTMAEGCSNLGQAEF